MKTLKILLDDNISHVSVTTYTSNGIGCLVTDGRIEFDIDEKHEICDMTSENLRINKNMKTKWNYDMDSCPLDTKVYLLSSNDCPLLPQMEYVGTITFNGRFKTNGKCYRGDSDYFYRSAIVAWREYKE